MPGTADYNRLPQLDVTVNGIRLHYVDVGVGPPVVLVHGSPLSSFAFRHQIAALSSRFRVIAPDLPGFGQSEAITEGPVFARQAEVLRALLRHLELGPIRLLGHDWGGPTGMGAVVDQLDRVKQLVLVNTTLRSDFRPPFYWKQFTTSRVGDFLLVRLNVFGWGLPSMMRAARSAEIRAHYLNHLKMEATRKTVLSLERLEGFAPLMERVEAALSDVAIPTLILWGHPDAYFSKNELEWLTVTFPDAEVREIPGGGHFPMEDASESVTEELLRFLS
jgi:haloalkane dehalogenase